VSVTIQTAAERDDMCGVCGKPADWRCGVFKSVAELIATAPERLDRRCSLHSFPAYATSERTAPKLER
jgi:hypothetical protein